MTKIMIKSYLTIGWRDILSNKVYSAINIQVLAAGMAVTCNPAQLAPIN